MYSRVVSEEKRWRWNRGTRFAEALRDGADDVRHDQWLTGLDLSSEGAPAPPLSLSPDQVTVALHDLAATRDEMKRLQDRLSELEEAVTRVQVAVGTSLSGLERALDAASAKPAASDAGGQDKGERHLAQPGEGKGWPKPPGTRL
jgi:hypothetical protein